MRRFEAVDALRGVAALAVALFHYTAIYGILYGHTSPPLVSLPRGDFAVELFFVISGFAILMTAERSDGIRDFVVSRFTRLFPLYWCCVLITWVVVQVSGPPDMRVGVGELLVNLTMLQDFVGVRPVDGAYWTLTVELVFYVGMGVALALGLLKGRRLGCLLCGWWGASVLLRLFDPAALAYAQIYLDARYAHLFIAGMCVYLGYSSGWDGWKLIGVLQAIPIAFMAGWIEACAIAVFMVVFWLALTRRLPVLAWRPLTILGLSSYALYLMHQNIGYAVIREAEARGVPATAAIVLALTLVVGAAVGMTFALERPLTKCLRHALSRAKNADARIGASPVAVSPAGRGQEALPARPLA